jgi:hypothetical protein
MEKAQISTDFLIVLSVALIMFMFMLNIAYDKSQQFSIQATQLYARQLTDQIAIEINAVYLAGNGASKSVYLPDTLQDNREYSFRIFPTYKLIEINSSEMRYSSFLSTSQISGNLNNLRNQITIKNENGAIVIS